MSNVDLIGSRSRSLTGPIHPRYSGAGGARVSRSGVSDPPEAVDVGQMCLAKLGVAHAQTLLGGQAQYTDLALVDVAVHVVGGLPGLVQRVDAGQCRVDLSLG